MCQQQRGKSFYSKVLVQSGLITPLEAAGSERLSASFVEIDAGVGELFNLLRTSTRTFDEKTGKSGGQLIWAGSVLSGPLSRSAKARYDYLVHLLESIRKDIKSRRRLARNTSDTSDRMAELFKSLCQKISYPSALQTALEADVAQMQERRVVPQIQTGLEVAQDAVNLQTEVDVTPSFRHDAPAQLTLALRCAEQGVCI